MHVPCADIVESENFKKHVGIRHKNTKQRHWTSDIIWGFAESTFLPGNDVVLYICRNESLDDRERRKEAIRHSLIAPLSFTAPPMMIYTLSLVPSVLANLAAGSVVST